VFWDTCHRGGVERLRGSVLLVGVKTPRLARCSHDNRTQRRAGGAGLGGEETQTGEVGRTKKEE